MRLTYWLSAALLISLNISAQEQKEVTIDGIFKNATISQFVNALERSSSYRFYYDPADFDSVKINLNVKAQPVPKILEQAFLSLKNFHFSIDKDNHIFLTKEYPIFTVLPVFLKDTTAATAPASPKQIEKLLSEKQGRNIEYAPQNKLYQIGLKTNQFKKGEVVLSGQVKNTITGEPVANATILVESAQPVITNQLGYYSLSLPNGYHTLKIEKTGMEDATFQVALYAAGTLDLAIAEKVVSLKEVVVSAEKLTNINRVQSGVEKLTIKAIKQVPTVFGETDVLRVVLTLPGVKTVGEASTGFNVRGGSADQNLILFNNSTIYNPAHFFGLFSAFNPDVVKDIELYKSSIPSKYGGRLSSVLDISSFEGNKNNYSGSAGIGLLTSRLKLEGPIQKDKTSFVFGARTTYANWLLNFLPDSYENSRASFYDVNLGVHHRINEKNELNVTGYLSKDRFNLNSDTTYGYSNKNISLKWNHKFNSRLNSATTIGIDRYEYGVSSEANPATAFKLDFDIKQLNVKTDFSYNLNNAHALDFGLSTIRYSLAPGSYKPYGKASLVEPDILSSEQGLESAVYLADRYTISNQFSIIGGIRYSLFNYLGPQKVNIYKEGLPKEEVNLTETKEYKRGAFIKTYGGPEYRLSFRYALSNSFSIKGGYNTLRQYIHMLSNTTAIAPTDIWKLSDANIKPQQGQQVSIGFYKNLKANAIEVSLEFYYKQLKDYLDYKPGATLVMNHSIETEVINTRGKAHGVELMVKKQEGKLNGWISYTYSKTLLKMDDPTIATPVNNGKFYPANYDKPHDLTLIGNYKINKRFSISLNSTYSTGRPITLPIGRYYYGGGERVLYSDRNAYRIPDYFRTDLSMNIEGNHKVKQKTHNSWTIGVYNITGRRNAYSVYYVTENGLINGYKMSIFGSVIPFVNYNIRF
jgi:hypothetical protein